MEALYRKYRPKRFSELVGQEHIKRILRNALEKQAVAHAYIFAGPRGTGKTTTARILAKSLNCHISPFTEPCNSCPSCNAVDSGVHLDVIELDAASNRGIDEVRKIRDGVNFAPAMGRFKVYIIDEVHMLTREAFNALLKTLEEPPGHVVFVLATTNPEKIPPTIASRCQILEFKNLSVDDIVGRLREISKLEGYDVGEDALGKIAKRAAGGLRDALSILEQVVRFTGGEIDARAVDEALGYVGEETVRRSIEALQSSKGDELMKIIEEIFSQKGDFDTFCSQIIEEALANPTSEMVELASEVYKIKRELRYAEEKLLIAKLLFVNLMRKMAKTTNRESAEQEGDGPKLALAEGSLKEPVPSDVGVPPIATETITSDRPDRTESRSSKEVSSEGKIELRSEVRRVTDAILDELKLRGDLSIFVGLSLAKVFEEDERVRIVFDESKRFSYEVLLERIEEVKMLYKNKNGRIKEVSIQLVPADVDPVLEKLKMLLGDSKEK